jgi:hypothetical protein
MVAVTATHRPPPRLSADATSVTDRSGGVVSATTSFTAMANGLSDETLAHTRRAAKSGAG